MVIIIIVAVVAGNKKRKRKLLKDLNRGAAGHSNVRKELRNQRNRRRSTGFGGDENESGRNAIARTETRVFAFTDDDLDDDLDAPEQTGGIANPDGIIEVLHDDEHDEQLQRARRRLAIRRKSSARLLAKKNLATKFHAPERHHHHHHHQVAPADDDIPGIELQDMKRPEHSKAAQKRWGRVRRNAFFDNAAQHVDDPFTSQFVKAEVIEGLAAGEVPVAHSKRPSRHKHHRHHGHTDKVAPMSHRRSSHRMGVDIQVAEVVPGGGGGGASSKVVPMAVQC